MNLPTTLVEIAQAFTARGEQEAIVHLREGGQTQWSYARLGGAIRELAAGLLAAGLQPGEAVAIYAPNRPEWPMAYLAILTAGGMAVPLDNNLTAPELARVLPAAACRRLFTVSDNLPRLAQARGERSLELIFLDSDAPSPPEGVAWTALARSATGVDFPQARPGDNASLLFTSGTTGTPKGVPLTHRNILASLAGVAHEAIVTPTDRVLLPLPMHHIYPFTAGMMGTLASGATLIFPAGLSGPQIVQAIKLGRASVMVGVPRLYEMLANAIINKAMSRGKKVAALVQAMLALSIFLRRHLGVRVGRRLFGQVHAELGGTLRLLSSGGAKLDNDTAWRLEGLGWEVLNGYGLTETAPILAFNARGRARIGSVGQASLGVALRLMPVPGRDDGEIQARGDNVFAGYWHHEEASRDAFTADGWFRTGDLGRMDQEGFLYITGRLKEVIVLADGKNIFPDEVEVHYSNSVYIKEVAVMEEGGLLTGLVVPDEETFREQGAARFHDILREEVARLSQQLPPYKRLSGFAITLEKLPRTQLGKLQRHLLAPIAQRAREGASAPQTEVVLDAADIALLEDAVTGPVWQWFKAKFPDKHPRLDSSPQLDLGVDSLQWVSLTLELEERFHLRLTDDALARVMTMRDFLVECQAASRNGGQVSERSLTPDQERLLSSAGWGYRLLAGVIFVLVRVLVGRLFPVRARGVEHIPVGEAVLFAPNHESYLDPLAIAAVLPYRRLRHTWWAGWGPLLHGNGVMRAISRAANVFPVDADRDPGGSLAYGRAILARGESLVWFPEGRRSTTGELLAFQPGVGLVLDRSRVRVVPVWLDGPFEAWPPEQARPRRYPLTVTFGEPVSWAELGGDEAPPKARAEALRRVVAALGQVEK